MPGCPTYIGVLINPRRVAAGFSRRWTSPEIGRCRCVKTALMRAVVRRSSTTLWPRSGTTPARPPDCQSAHGPSAGEPPTERPRQYRKLARFHAEVERDESGIPTSASQPLKHARESHAVQQAEAKHQRDSPRLQIEGEQILDRHIGNRCAIKGSTIGSRAAQTGRSAEKKRPATTSRGRAGRDGLRPTSPSDSGGRR